MSKIYLLHETGGEYEDKYDNVCGVFDTIEKAEKMMMILGYEEDEYQREYENDNAEEPYYEPSYYHICSMELNETSKDFEVREPIIYRDQFLYRVTEENGTYNYQIILLRKE